MTLYFFAALLLVAGAVVALIAWRNAQPTSTVGQLLQATEEGPGRAADGTGSARPKA